MVEMENLEFLDEEKEQNRLDFCRYCLFYECELVGDYTHFGGYYWQVGNHPDEDSSFKDEMLNMYPDMKGKCSMCRRYVEQIECGRQNVSDGIGEHYKVEVDKNGKIGKHINDKWEPLQPVFISAQTGQGKNYFIENTLIPYVREINYRNNTSYKVLIISNRLALKQQIKNHINKNDDLENENYEIYAYKEFADVMTYQSLLRREKDLKKKNYLYVICDEAHFFTSDAMFNPDTQKILSTIVQLFQKAIRVYMSATPYECLEYIIKYEDGYKEHISNYNKPQSKHQYAKMVFYYFERDYNYLDTKTYSSIVDLYGEIVKSVEKKEKWLLFIDDKKACEKVRKELVAYAKKNKKSLENKNVFAVDANSKKNDVYQEIVNKEMLNKDTYVLISTSVLDNGVNLTGITHIVVSDMEKVKCLQMVGRARVDNRNGRRKILYVKRFEISEVKTQITRLKKQQDAYHSYQLAYDEPQSDQLLTKYREYEFLNKYYNDKDEDWKNAKHWFGRPKAEPAKLYLNEIAKSLLDRMVSRYQFILEEMEEESLQANNKQHNQKEEKHVGQRYLEYQLSWFGKEYRIDDDITFADKEKAKKEFINFLELYIGKKVPIKNETGVDQFKEEFAKLQNAAFGRKDRNKGRVYDVRKMNMILQEEKVGYTVLKEKIEGTSYWIVKKHD